MQLLVNKHFTNQQINYIMPYKTENIHKNILPVLVLFACIYKKNVYMYLYQLFSTYNINSA